MAQVHRDGASAEVAELEKNLLQEVEDALDLLQTLQKTWISELQPERLQEASGRRCVLKIIGLQTVEYSKVFEVTPTGVAVHEGGGDQYNTLIEAPLASVLNVLQGVIQGRPDAFSAEWARSRARVSGERKIHDGWLFNKIFGELAELIRLYRFGGGP